MRVVGSLLFCKICYYIVVIPIFTGFQNMIHVPPGVDFTS